MRSASPSPLASGYVRTLGRLDDTAAPPARDDPFAQRLAQWLDWTQAIALSAALAEPPPPAAPAPDTRADRRELARVRAELARQVSATCADLAPGFAALRQQVLACQMAMDARIAPLRRRVRATLARSPQARLAPIDAVMEQVMAPQERTLLSGALKRLQARHAARPDNFATELQALLMAELELRLQPVEGLIEACQAPRDTA